MTLEFDRYGVLAHRMVVQDLAKPVRDTVDCRTLSVGHQNTPPGSGLTGVNARTIRSARTVSGLLDVEGPLVVVMAARGAPHVVSRSELPLITAALSPFDEQDATEVEEVAHAMREIANCEAISRPALSEALNDKVVDSLRGWCERCKSRHVREGLFRKASLQAGLELDPAAASPTMFRPSGIHLPAMPDREQARAELARRYIHLIGVARPADLAAWLGYKPGDVRATWNLIAKELTPCDVAGKRRWALSSDVESLSDATRRGGAKLLPPFDPYLLGDRSLVVLEREHQRRLWRAQVSPGAILVNGEIVGTWRSRMSGSELHVTLNPFPGLGAMETKGLEREAAEIAALRGAQGVAITRGED
ncbi:MAG: winged helix DNA-binding domain-containing protein [Actinomycetota bacterium]|nr:winged helix DNA-binding domain-containing protein [Actinomycetota bacterium]